MRRFSGAKLAMIASSTALDKVVRVVDASAGPVPDDGLLPELGGRDLQPAALLHRDHGLLVLAGSAPWQTPGVGIIRRKLTG